MQANVLRPPLEGKGARVIARRFWTDAHAP